MPAPPAMVRPTKPTRHSSESMPLYSARPPQTPPAIRSVPLRSSSGRAEAPGGGDGCSPAGGFTGGGVVGAQC